MDKNDKLFKQIEVIGTENANYKNIVESITTTNATATPIQVIVVPNNSSVYFESKVLAVQTGGSAGTPGDSANFVLISGLLVNDSVTVQLVGYTVTPVPSEWKSAAASTWEITLALESDGLHIEANGENNKTINWLITSKILLSKF